MGGVSDRGYVGIGIEHPKTGVNVGTLWRSANVFGAAFIFTVGRRYQHQGSDTLKSPRHVPLLHFGSIDDLVDHLPHGCPLVAIEQAPGSELLPSFAHPERAAYLLGAEDHGLTDRALRRSHYLVEIPTVRCLNVAVAGSIVLYDRVSRSSAAHKRPTTAECATLQAA